MNEAFDRQHQEELRLHAHREALTSRMLEAKGRHIFLPPPPVHPLDFPANPADLQPPPSVDERHAQRFVKVITRYPRFIFDLESRPSKEDADDLALALSDYSRHHPELAGKMWDTVNLVLCVIAVAAPWVGEVVAKKRGTWDDVKAKYEMMGWIDIPKLEPGKGIM